MENSVTIGADGVLDKVIETFEFKATKKTFPESNSLYILCNPLKCIYLITENVLRTNCMYNNITNVFPCFYGGVRLP